MSRRFLIIMAVLIAVFVGVVIVNKDRDDSTGNGGNGSGTEGSNYVLGAGTDGVELVEFGDFQCSACRSYYPIMKQVKDKYGDRIKFQYRHFPLVQIHQNAMIAHRAAEAAGRQNKFWEMHDILFERQDAWGGSNNATAIMDDYASELAINIDKFKEDFASQSVNDTIQADIKAGQALQVTSTPSFTLNGQKIEDLPRDVAGFSRLIDEQISSQDN